MVVTLYLGGTSVELKCKHYITSMTTRAFSAIIYSATIDPAYIIYVITMGLQDIATHLVVKVKVRSEYLLQRCLRSQTRDQKRFTIVEVTAYWHELIIPRRIFRANKHCASVTCSCSLQKSILR